jgi:hypothetical protein
MFGQRLSACGGKAMSLTNDTVECTLVHAGVYEDVDRYCLQIEMQNTFAITLTLMRDGSQPPRTTIWKGQGECGFEEYGARGVEAFKEFVEIALGRRPLSSTRRAKRGRPPLTLVKSEDDLDDRPPAA